MGCQTKHANSLMNILSFPKIIITLALFLTLISCVPATIGSSVVVGNAAVKEKAIKESVSDSYISFILDAHLLEYGIKSPNNYVDALVDEGRVLLVGVVSDVNKWNDAQTLAKNIKGVKEVINEIEILEQNFGFKSVSDNTYDAALTTEIKTRLLFSYDISSSNYSIITVNSIVYLIGIAKDREEMESVAILASRVKGVKKVINHVILRSDARRGKNK